MAIPADTITHGGADMNWACHALKFKDPADGVVKTMSTTDIQANATLRNHVLGVAVGATAADRAHQIRTGYKKNGSNEVLNTQGQVYVTNGGVVDYDYDEYYSLLFKKAPA